MNTQNKKLNVMPIVKKIYTNHTYLFSFLLLLAIMVIINPSYFSYTSLSTLVMQSTIKGILALGMAVVIICAMFDLSVGANIAITAGVGIVILNATGNTWLMLAFCIVFSMLLTTISGFIISKGKIAPFIVTLAMMSIYRSIIVQLGQGGPFNVSPEILKSFRLIAAGSSLGIPNLAIVFIVLVVLTSILMGKTKFGRYIYAVGSNEVAAKLAGVNVNRIKTMAFSVLGFLVGISSFLFASRLTSVTAASAGLGYELDAIAAVAIGGTSFTGGRGTITGTLFGALVLQMIEGVLIAARIPPFLTGLVKGIIILIAVLFQSKKDMKKV